MDLTKCLSSDKVAWGILFLIVWFCLYQGVEYYKVSSVPSINWKDATAIGDKNLFFGNPNYRQSHPYVQEERYQKEQTARKEIDLELNLKSKRKSLKNEGQEFVKVLDTEAFVSQNINDENHIDRKKKKSADGIGELTLRRNKGRGSFIPKSPKNLYET